MRRKTWFNTEQDHHYWINF